MQIQLLPFCLIAATLFSAQVSARDWVTDNSFGAGPLSCKDWVRDRANDQPWRWNNDAEWMFGFLTALVRAKGPLKDDSGGMTAEDFPGEIDELCAAHPDWGIPEILELFAVRHRLIAAQPNEGTKAPP